MPKLKTSKTMTKRVKITASGRILRRKATRAHKLTLKSAARKRAYTLEHSISRVDQKSVKKLLGLK